MKKNNQESNENKETKLRAIWPKGNTKVSEHFLGRNYVQEFTPSAYFVVHMISDPKFFFDYFIERGMSSFFIGNLPKIAINNLKSIQSVKEFDDGKKRIYQIATSTPESVDDLLRYIFIDVKLANKDPFNLISHNKKDLINRCSDAFAYDFVTGMSYSNTAFKKDLPREDLELMLKKFPEQNADCFYCGYPIKALRSFWEAIDSDRFYHLLEKGFKINESVSCLESLDDKYLKNASFRDKIAKKIATNEEQSFAVLKQTNKQKLLLLGRSNIDLLDTSASEYTKMNELISKYQN